MLFLLAAGAATGCATHTVPVRPPADASGTGAVAAARALIGTPYRDGGSTPSGFDCSGFVRYVFSELGVVLPRSVQQQLGAGRRVDRDRLKAGDLVFFAIDGRTLSHVGIASGRDTFVHAPSARGQVREESLSTPYWKERYREARRVVDR